MLCISCFLRCTKLNHIFNKTRIFYGRYRYINRCLHIPVLTTSHCIIKSFRCSRDSYYARHWLIDSILSINNNAINSFIGIITCTFIISCTKTSVSFINKQEQMNVIIFNSRIQYIIKRTSTFSFICQLLSLAK